MLYSISASRNRNCALRRWGALALLLPVLLLPACSGRVRKADPVDSDQAVTALKAALDSWKKGEPPATLRKGTPAITVQDMDWESGFRLTDYQLVGEGKLEDANLRCQVTLTLRDPQGREVKKKVQYIVGTSPKITVFRELFQG